MKKILTLVLIGQLFAPSFVAYAQTANAAVNTTVNGSAGYEIPPPRPTTVPPNTGNSGFIQFNNLTVESVTGNGVPAEIVATNGNIYPMMENGKPGPAMMGAGTSLTNVTCVKFSSANGANGTTTTCPTPPQAPTGTPNSVNTVNTANTGVSNQMYPIRYQPYKIEVDASTMLYLRDRQAGSVSDITPGDQLNVYGYYNTNGTIQAYLIRDLTKPVVSEFIQLNNANLISVSSNTNGSATLVVAQRQGYGCYGYGVNGTQKANIVCPMGVRELSARTETKNIAVPSSLQPDWALTRKYVVTVGVQTILLDNNRTRLSLGDLRVGDELNIYGQSTSDGQTVNADIVRDLSIPATPSTYGGTVTTVNADGSFVIATDDGRTITVQSPIKVGAVVRVSGILDRLSNILSQVTAFFLGNNINVVPLGASGQMRVQGGTVTPSTGVNVPNRY